MNQSIKKIIRILIQNKNIIGLRPGNFITTFSLAPKRFKFKKIKKIAHSNDIN